MPSSSEPPEARPLVGLVLMPFSSPSVRLLTVMLLVATSCRLTLFCSCAATKFSLKVELLLFADDPSAMVMLVGSISRVPPLPGLTAPRTVSCPCPDSSTLPPWLPLPCASMTEPALVLSVPSATMLILPPLVPLARICAPFWISILRSALMLTVPPVPLALLTSSVPLSVMSPPEAVSSISPLWLAMPCARISPLLLTALPTRSCAVCAVMITRPPSAMICPALSTPAFFASVALSTAKLTRPLPSRSRVVAAPLASTTVPSCAWITPVFLT